MSSFSAGAGVSPKLVKSKKYAFSSAFSYQHALFIRTRNFYANGVSSLFQVNKWYFLTTKKRKKQQGNFVSPQTHSFVARVRSGLFMVAFCPANFSEARPGLSAKYEKKMAVCEQLQRYISGNARRDKWLTLEEIPHLVDPKWDCLILFRGVKAERTRSCLAPKKRFGGPT